VRDNFLDTGRITPSPSGVVDPFDSASWVNWWESADIKIDSPDPTTNAYAYSGLDIDYLSFEDLEHDNPRRDTTVRAYVQVHTRGNEPATNVRVRAFWADAHLGLPNLPSNFWSAFPNSDPTMTDWHAIGPTQTIQSIAPARPRVVGWSWHVDPTAATHTCLLAVVTSDEDPIAVTTTDTAGAVNGSSHVTLKNLHVDDFIPGAAGSGSPLGPYIVGLAISERRYPIDIRFFTRGLPEGTVFHIGLPSFKASHGTRATLRGVRAIEKAPPSLRKLEQPGCREPIEFDWSRVFVLETPDPKRAARRELPGLYGLQPDGARFAAAFTVTLPRRFRGDQPLSFHVEQWEAERLVGGSTYQLRPAKPTRARRGRRK
jgi:hypothetical protein